MWPSDKALPRYGPSRQQQSRTRALYSGVSDKHPRNALPFAGHTGSGSFDNSAITQVDSTWRKQRRKRSMTTQALLGLLMQRLPPTLSPQSALQKVDVKFSNHLRLIFTAHKVCLVVCGCKAYLRVPVARTSICRISVMSRGIY